MSLPHCLNSIMTSKILNQHKTFFPMVVRWESWRVCSDKNIFPTDKNHCSVHHKECEPCNLKYKIYILFLEQIIVISQVQPQSTCQTLMVQLLFLTLYISYSQFFKLKPEQGSQLFHLRLSSRPWLLSAQGRHLHVLTNLLIIPPPNYLLMN